MTVNPNYYHRKYNWKWFLRLLGTWLIFLNIFIFCCSILLYVNVEFHQIPDGKGYLYHLITWVSLNLVTILILLIYWLIRYHWDPNLYIYSDITDPNRVLRATSPFDQHQGFSTPPDTTSNESATSSTGEEDTLCLICYRHFNPEKGEVIFTECCQQLLHAECQAEWLSKQDLCPFPYCHRTIIN